MVAQRRNLKRKASRRSEPTAWYEIAIKGWDYSYLFSINDPKRDAEPYGEYRHVELRGDVLQPTELAQKAPQAKLTLMADRALLVGRTADRWPEAVGSLYVRAGVLYGLLSLPAATMPEILWQLSVERLKFASLSGASLRYGSTKIVSFRFSERAEDDEEAD